MTGIERLRKLSEDMLRLSLWVRLTTGTEKDWDCYQGDGRTVNDELLSIADQIERERACDADTIENIRLIVGGVVTDMERHVSGVEGTDDSPVARWARELREALGGNGRDHAAYVSVSAYDLLPQEDREAIAWVREHGGVDELTCMFQDADSRRVELCGALGIDLDKGWSEAMAAIRLRLMPEGLEWPRYESGELVQIGDEFMGKDGKTYAAKQIQFIGKCFSLFDFCDRKPQFSGFYGEPVKRPAPKVLDADGMEIREGDRVWSTQLDEPNEWIVIDPHKDRGDSQTVLVSIGDRTGHARPENLTHQRPVLDADGVPIKVGDTVYFTDGREQECNTVVHAKYSYKGEPYVQLGRLNEAGYPTYTNCSCIDPSQLTHTKPEPTESWERIEEDAKKYTCDYFGHAWKTCDGCPAYSVSGSCKPVMASDLVRRCRALAERERGE